MVLPFRWVSWTGWFGSAADRGVEHKAMMSMSMDGPLKKVYLGPVVVGLGFRESLVGDFCSSLP